MPISSGQSGPLHFGCRHIQSYTCHRVEWAADDELRHRRHAKGRAAKGVKTRLFAICSGPDAFRTSRPQKSRITQRARTVRPRQQRCFGARPLIQTLGKSAETAASALIKLFQVNYNEIRENVPFTFSCFCAEPLRLANKRARTRALKTVCRRGDKETRARELN